MVALAGAAVCVVVISFEVAVVVCLGSGSAVADEVDCVEFTDVVVDDDGEDSDDADGEDSDDADEGEGPFS